MRVEVVAEGLEVPWEIAWLPDGRALITERPGRIRMLDGTLVAEVPVSALGEGGLMGLALDPEFETPAVRVPVLHDRRGPRSSSAGGSRTTG